MGETGMTEDNKNAHHLIEKRYGETPGILSEGGPQELLISMLSRGSCRAFQNRTVPDEVLNLLCATAFAAPTKSDLQQRDIIVVKCPQRRTEIAGLVGGQAWVAQAPTLLVFCGNNRRQRLLHKWHDVPFANDHLDALFNAVADAAIALGAFVTAAEALGLGCCPISAIRNEAKSVSQLLNLPDHVFPFAGLALGYPKHPADISCRLPLSVTYHTDRYTEEGLQDKISGYDARRAKTQPYEKQRFVTTFGEKAPYTWSDDKVRQYSEKERADFGTYIRDIGFKLD